MGDGEREGDEVFVGYPCKRVSRFLFCWAVYLLMILFVPSSRRPFVPADHWLVTSQLDMNSFVEAAVYVLPIYSLFSTHPTLLLQPRRTATIKTRLGPPTPPVQAPNRRHVTALRDPQHHPIRHFDSKPAYPSFTIVMNDMTSRGPGADSRESSIFGA